MGHSIEITKRNEKQLNGQINLIEYTFGEATNKVDNLPGERVSGFGNFSGCDVNIAIQRDAEEKRIINKTGSSYRFRDDTRE